VLEEKLLEECDRSLRYNRPFSVAIFDVDNFKEINDAAGHAVGDEALKGVASTMMLKKRSSDTVARYGGDEFVILMPETDAESARVAADRIRSMVFEEIMAGGNSISTSCGVAQFNGTPDEKASDVLRRADTALYEAKHAGRNCTKVA
jgi:diguanylate cyclase (GGDEF)-like protein